MLLPVVALLLALVTSSEAQLQWELLDDGNHTAGDVPLARRDAAIGYDADSNVVILFGGRAKTNAADVVLGDTWIFDLAKRQWRRANPASSPPPRFSFVSGVSNGYMYISTGEGPNDLFLNDIWRFYIKNEEWEELPAQQKPDYYTAQQWTLQSRTELKPSFRYGAAGGVFPNSSRFYVSLGFAARRYADTFSYSILEKGWYQEFPDLGPYSPGYPHARCLHAGTMISSNELLIFGGCLTGGGTGGPCPSGDSWVFDGKTKEWTMLESCASPRIYASMAMLPTKNGERRVVLYGGQEKNKQVLTTVESKDYQVAVFKPDTKEWSLRATQGKIPSKRASSAMVTGKDGIFMFGGINVGSTRLNNDLYLLRGDGASADQSPESAPCRPTFFNLLTLHGILMVLGWGFFLQWGAFIARFMDHKRALWFHLHRLFQIFGLLIAIAGLVCGIMSVQFGHFKFAHAIIGLVVMILGVFQPINALFRPHPPEAGEPKAPKRAFWEWIHKFTGRGTLALALVNISLGIFLAVASMLLWSLWFAYMGALLLINFFAECNNKCVSSAEPLPAPKPAGKYILRDKQTSSLFGDKHHGYDNAALESEG